MSQSSKWKTIGYAAAIFIAGGVSGGALGVYHTKSHLFDPQPEQEIAEHLKVRLTTRLDLTSEQLAKINPIADDTASQLRASRAEAAQRIDQIFEKSYSQISAILTPDQRVKLNRMQTERRDTMSRWQGGEGRRRPPGQGGPNGPNGPNSGPNFDRQNRPDHPRGPDHQSGDRNEQPQPSQPQTTST